MGACDIIDICDSTILNDHEDKECETFDKKNTERASSMIESIDFSDENKVEGKITFLTDEISHSNASTENVKSKRVACDDSKSKRRVSLQDSLVSYLSFEEDTSINNESGSIDKEAASLGPDDAIIKRRSALSTETSYSFLDDEERSDCKLLSQAFSR